MSNPARPTGRKSAVALWTIQGLLAALFLFAGGMKLVMPIAAITQQIPMPGGFLRFIGVVEVLGALGLILPGLLRIRQELTPLAAAGLVIIMSGAVGVTLAIGGGIQALTPGVVGIASAAVAVARWRRLPARSWSGESALRLAA